MKRSFEIFDDLCKILQCELDEDLDQGLVNRCCEDPDEILSEVLAVIAQVLMRRSCEDPAGIVYGVLA